MSTEELRLIGFKPELPSSTNGIMNYYIVDEINEKVFIQVSTKNTDIVPVLVVSQDNWDDMKENTTYLTLWGINNVDSLKNQIENIKNVLTIKP